MTVGLRVIVAVLNTYCTTLTMKSTTVLLGLCTNIQSDNSSNCHCLTLRRFLVVAFLSFICSLLLLPLLLFPFHLLHFHLLLIVLLLFLDQCVCNFVILLMACFFASLYSVLLWDLLMSHSSATSSVALWPWHVTLAIDIKITFSSFNFSLLFSVTLCDLLERVNLIFCIIQFLETLLVTYL